MSGCMTKKETMLSHDPFSTEILILASARFPSSLYQKRGQIKSILFQSVQDFHSQL